MSAATNAQLARLADRRAAAEVKAARLQAAARERQEQRALEAERRAEEQRRLTSRREGERLQREANDRLAGKTMTATEWQLSGGPRLARARRRAAASATKTAGLSATEAQLTRLGYLTRDAG